MSEGKSGFAVATFASVPYEVQTEMPNTVLRLSVAPVMKRPAMPAKKVKKKQEEPEPAEEQPAPEAGEAEGEGEEEDAQEDFEEGEEEAGFEPDEEVSPDLPATQDYASEKQPAQEQSEEPVAPVSFDPKGRKDAKDRHGNVIPWTRRLAMYPLGCGKCVQKPGCTPSCYKYRDV